MVVVMQERIWSCRRDYWRLDVESTSDAEGVLASLRGRRQTSDPFWAPVVMDTGALARFGASLLSAVTVVSGFQVIGVSGCRCRSASRELLARCCGAFYELEIYGSLIAGELSSAELRAVLPAAGRRPVVHLMDRDIEAFCADVAAALAAMNEP